MTSTTNYRNYVHCSVFSPCVCVFVCVFVDPKPVDRGTSNFPTFSLSLSVSSYTCHVTHVQPHFITNECF